MTNRISKPSKGKLHHECPDWDFMEIDENDPEFASCTCEWEDHEAAQLAAWTHEIKPNAEDYK